MIARVRCRGLVQRFVVGPCIAYCSCSRVASVDVVGCPCSCDPLLCAPVDCTTEGLNNIKFMIRKQIIEQGIGFCSNKNKLNKPYCAFILH